MNSNWQQKKKQFTFLLLLQNMSGDKYLIVSNMFEFDEL